MTLALSPAQQDAITANENILCCACPGSGKTRVLVEKVKHVLTTTPDARIILTTFSRDAAREMSERIQVALKAMKQERLMAKLTIGTFHSLAMRQLKQAGLAKRILSPIETEHIIHRSLQLTRLDIHPDEAEAAIYSCKADPVYRARHPREAILTDTYQKELATRNVCDFADLLLQANALMAKGKLAPLDATHVFADEMQDIDAVQLLWLGFHCAGERIACAVGDDDQSIYGFRAALGYRAMMEFQASTNARIIALDTNYRSVAGILESAGRLIGTNMERVPKQLKAHRGEGAPPKVVFVADETSQALDIIAALDGLCAGNEVPSTKHATPYRFGVRSGQAAVLARTNRRLTFMARIFNEYRVPYLQAGSSLWDTHTAQAYLALLQALHQKESTGIEVALRWAGVPDRTIRALEHVYAGNLWSMFTSGVRIRVDSGPEAADLVHFGNNWAKKLSGQHDDGSVSNVIRDVHGWMEAVANNQCGIDESGGGRTRAGRNRHLPHMWIITAVRDVLVGLDGTLPSRAAQARMEGEQRFPRVILSTFHAAKGLEFDHVFLVDVITGVVPKLDLTATDADVEEERRCLYVAMTRARDSLTIYTGSDPDKTSEFLYDAGLMPSNSMAMAA